MNYIASAFSLAMLPSVHATLTVAPVSASDVPTDAVSVVGHPNTAEALSILLDRPVPFSRISLQLQSGDTLYVSQFRWPGGRAPENFKANTLEQLPPITWMMVKVH